MLKIILNENSVDIHKTNDQSFNYSIRKDELPCIIVKNKINISLWIDQLMDKTWIEKNTLYELASLISKECPTHKINWVSTFFPVEKQEYLNHVKIVKNIYSQNQESNINFDSILEDIRTGIEEQNKDINDEIEQIVNNNLKKYKII